MHAPSTGPDPAAEKMAGAMLSQDDLMHDILRETVESHQDGQIKESGRTFCPDGGQEVHGPLGRFPTAVDLARCPRGATGVMHTHVTREQLLDPEHSLPDMANVVFGEVDASVVVGAHSSEVMVTPSVESAAQEAFSDALGAGVSSASEVVETVKKGNIDPPSARERVRSNLPSLFYTQATSFPNIASQVHDTGIKAASVSSGGMMHGCMSTTMHTHEGDGVKSDAGNAEYIRHLSDGTGSAAVENVSEGGASINITHVVIGSIIGDIAVRGFNRLVR